MPLGVLDTQMEEVARAITLALRANIEDTIDDVWTEMVDKDAEFYAAIGETVPVTPKLYPARWFQGHHPSILWRPVEDYPNIAVVVYNHASAGDDGDQYETANNIGYVEAFCVHPDESTINRLAWRYAKALHRVISSLRGVGEDAEDLSFTPTVNVSNAAARRVEEFGEAITYIQGCRAELTLRTVGTW